ncbi:hypothetical protein EROM_071720 [Encephalitozoon romaleae SJ-2008]|uniref:Uncharacterized protein n=1 Tax=Encephalitozoon romaleae (strain SJ-2008) TaxID=1178016 RepID=I6ZJK2_ENCRO|nr:hypothetical protein EROM_071720 [Encephalitozoon romaleae SJ-2008]AFN83423.1 hypothetical protein EROM_071720 [Encephalitozoon romaleae SJ-2008]
MNTQKDITDYIQNIEKKLGEIVSSEASKKLLSAEEWFRERKIKTDQRNVDGQFSKVIKSIRNLMKEAKELLESIRNGEFSLYRKDIFNKYNKEIKKVKNALETYKDNICSYRDSKHYCQGKTKVGVSCVDQRKQIASTCLSVAVDLENTFVKPDPDTDISTTQTDVYEFLVQKYLLSNPKSTESQHNSSLSKTEPTYCISEGSIESPPLKRKKSASCISEKIGNPGILKVTESPGIVNGATNFKVFKKDYFLLLFCIISLGLMAFLGITKKVEASEKILGIAKKVAYTISILGPILHGRWILTNEDYNRGIVEVLSKNWNVIGSMFPMLLVLKKDSLRKTFEGKASVESYGAMVGMSVIMMCSQTFSKRDRKIHGRQMNVFVIGNILMGMAYVNNFIALSARSGHNLVLFGHIIFGLILCFMIIIEGGDRMEDTKSKGMEWTVIFQWIMSWIFVIFGFQNLESCYFHYTKNTI